MKTPEKSYIVKLAEEFQGHCDAYMKEFSESRDWQARGQAAAFETAAHRLTMAGGPINDSYGDSTTVAHKENAWAAWMHLMEDLKYKASEEMSKAQHENRRIWALYQAGKLEGYRRIMNRIIAWRTA